MKTVRRLVCGNCGAFLPKLDPDSEADMEFLCRCGPDWTCVESEMKVGRRRQRRLPGVPRRTRKKGVDG